MCLLKIKTLSVELVEVKSRLETLQKANEQLSSTAGAQKAEIVRLTKCTVDARATEEQLARKSVEASGLQQEVAQLTEFYSREQEKNSKLSERMKEVVRAIVIYTLSVLICYCLFGCLAVSA